MSARVTIHLPTYNQGRFLAHALDGALSQTYDDYEVIVSNNWSTDETEAVLAKYAGHARLRVVQPPEFLGVVDHFKFCIAQSRSEYFSYLCTDDGLLPEFLAEQVALLDRHPSVGFVHSAAQMIGEHDEVIYLEKSIRPTGVTPGREALKGFIYNARCIGDSVLFRRSAFDAVGGFGDLYALDWEVELRMCAVGDIAYNQNVLMQYRLWDAPERTIPNQLKLMRCARELYEKFEPEFPEYRAIFRRARLVRAFDFVNALEGMNDEQRAQALREIRAIARHPLVEAKVRAFEMGWGRHYLALNALRHRGKRLVKSLLYPLLAPSRT